MRREVARAPSSLAWVSVILVDSAERVFSKEAGEESSRCELVSQRLIPSFGEYALCAYRGEDESRGRRTLQGQKETMAKDDADTCRAQSGMAQFEGPWQKRQERSAKDEI